jgi:response regulator RpfG family c-di-GMP phosphodiesterase
METTARSKTAQAINCAAAPMAPQAGGLTQMNTVKRQMPDAEAVSKVLIVDDESTICTILKEVVYGLDPDVVVKTFADPLKARAWAREHVADLILVDFHMPEMDGISFVNAVRGNPDYEHVPIIMVTVDVDSSLRFGALEAGVTDVLNKPLNVRECAARCRNLLKLRRQQLRLEERADVLSELVKRSTKNVRDREEETLIRLAKAGEFRDEETGNHVLRMARYSALIATAIGMDSTYADTILKAAPLHDIGKIGVPDNILLKPGRLTVEEWGIMCQHPQIGHEILKGSSSKYIRMGADIALAHHEKFDGSGYPSGLSGEAIPLAGRIVAIADVYDALTSARPYKARWESERAFGFLSDNSGRHFDPRLVRPFLQLREHVIEIQQQLLDAGGGFGHLTSDHHGAA